ncbi:MAG: phospho-N-acetylmuramoyl-pentapeptide-transferase [Firmicutes bacterium]|nr:phospho-N-acetylmuramoyl-pentapeptide-transferase [Bacillota bacterium]MCL2771582.1 phospho-N-acetylmuramoyl-pentapeptide-transferase [Bacillota bacterium]
MLTTFLFAFILAFGISLFFAPIYIRFARRIKLGQNILHYVESHYSKQGTPTMGGVIFIVGTILGTIIFLDGSSSLALMTIGVTTLYGLLGFLDDFLKIKKRDNLGLKARHKLLGQCVLSLFVAFFVYSFSPIGSYIFIPFMAQPVNIGFFVFPLTILVFVATTNSINLTDGLDGLASRTTQICLLAFLAMLIVLSNSFGFNITQLTELHNLMLVIIATVGALFAFGLFNSFPAKIFMGDAGSLALGALVSCVAVFTGLSLFLLFFGFLFVLSSLSVMLQVLYFKKTKGKRIFLMAPLHHHFEKKGIHENRIVSIYSIIGIIISSIVVVAHYFIY